ncbi:hypothetical protein FRC17_010708, partial [Serendipita sp. 399]
MVSSVAPAAPAVMAWHWEALLEAATSITVAPLWPVLFLSNILLRVLQFIDYLKRDKQVDMGQCIVRPKKDAVKYLPNAVLLQLPEEVLLCIASYMGAHELLSFAAASRRLRQLSQASILFWTGAVVSALLPRRATIQDHQVHELRRSVLRSTRNQLLGGGNTGPSRRKVELYLDGITTVNSEKLVPGTPFFICAIGSSEDSTCKLVLADLQIGRVISQVEISEELSNCVIGIKTYSNVCFHIAVMGRIATQRTHLWQVFKVVVSQHGESPIAANVVCEAEGTVEFEEDKSLGDIRITKEMLLFQKVGVHEYWQLYGLLWARQPTEIVPLCDEKVEKTPVSWEASDDWVVSCIWSQEIQLDLLTRSLGGFLRIQESGKHIEDLCRGATSIHFEGGAYPCPTGSGSPVCDGVVHTRLNGATVLNFFQMCLPHGGKRLNLKEMGTLTIPFELQRLTYSNGYLWCTDETRLYFVQKRGGEWSIRSIPDLALGYFDLMDVEAGL